MPTHVRTIELYTCDFKCGHKAEEKYKLLNHEEKCHCNPLNKACRVCANCAIDHGFMICNLKDLYFKITKLSDKKVYDKDMSVVWEVKEFPKYQMDNWEECEKIEKHNQSRPFPTKNCNEFKLGKKIF